MLRVYNPACTIGCERSPATLELARAQILSVVMMSLEDRHEALKEQVKANRNRINSAWHQLKDDGADILFIQQQLSEIGDAHRRQQAVCDSLAEDMRELKPRLLALVARVDELTSVVLPSTPVALPSSPGMNEGARDRSRSPKRG